MKSHGSSRFGSLLRAARRRWWVLVLFGVIASPIGYALHHMHLVNVQMRDHIYLGQILDKIGAHWRAHQVEPRLAGYGDEIAGCRLVDQRGHRIVYSAWREGNQERWILVSPGSDGRMDRPLADYERMAAEQPDRLGRDVLGDFAADIVQADGKLVQFPDLGAANVWDVLGFGGR